MAPASRKGAAVSSKGRDEVAVEVLLPKIGLTMQEGTIDEWLVPTGTAVSEGEALLRLATDKVDVEVEAEACGLFHPVVAAGTTVPAGALIGWLLAEGEQLPEAPAPNGNGVGAAPSGHGVNASAAPSLNGSAASVGHGGRLLASPNAPRCFDQHSQLLWCLVTTHQQRDGR